MSVPLQVRIDLRELIRQLADEAEWDSLANADKSNFYDHWTDDSRLGGVLCRYIDKGQVRVYLKDTLLKGYAQQKIADPARVFRILKIPTSVVVDHTYRNPHGRALADGRVIAWGRADEWRQILLALHERTFGQKSRHPCAGVLMRAAGRFSAEPFRRMVEDVGRKLDVKQVVWLDS